MPNPRTGLRVSALTAAAVLLALLVSTPLIAAGHRCIFDKLQRLQLATGTSAVPEVRDRGAPQRQGAEQHGSFTAPDAWEPIRISVFTEDLDDNSRYCTQPGEMKPDFKGSMMKCNSKNILTDEKKQLLRKQIIPDAIQMHKDRLLVQPLRDNIRVEHFTGDVCSHFTIPQSHHDTGVPDTDFLLYVAAGPTVPRFVAWAITCQYDPSGRPLVGVANIGFTDTMDIIHSTRTLSHELLHALGFDYQLFENRNMINTVSVRNKPASYVLKSPKVVEVARAHYGCSTMQYVELDDLGSTGAASSHWKMRNAKDDLMAFIDSAGFYTAITIAAMEDTGYYKGNYRNAESMAWGKNAGCVLFDKKCVIDGVSQVPEMFCEGKIASISEYRCTSDRMGIGDCLMTYYTNLPLYFQYFPDPTIGGTEDWMDYCPFIKAYSDTMCFNGDARMLPGSVFSESARCFSAVPRTPIRISNRQNMLSICADVQCDKDTSRYRVRVKGTSDFVDCPPGSTLVLSDYSTEFKSGAIECAPYEEMCPESHYTDVNNHESSEENAYQHNHVSTNEDEAVTNDQEKAESTDVNNHESTNEDEAVTNDQEKAESTDVNNHESSEENAYQHNHVSTNEDEAVTNDQEKAESNKKNNNMNNEINNNESSSGTSGTTNIAYHLTYTIVASLDVMIVLLIYKWR
ncbi:unnamed protein product [Phytomonas sp. Hart1]|nr:unnamed protein product [Phytomonas sp. Hart1]|eukprot:CCW69206.1 unnamed protein product [Phytomonas sp. isolate Hart1]